MKVSKISLEIKQRMYSLHEATENRKVKVTSHSGFLTVELKPSTRGHSDHGKGDWKLWTR